MLALSVLSQLNCCGRKLGPALVATGSAGKTKTAIVHVAELVEHLRFASNVLMHCIVCFAETVRLLAIEALVCQHVL